MSGGTDTHLLLLDVRSKGLTGRRAEKLLNDAHIFVNKNMIPFDPEKPMTTSGIRLGTPSVTTRGMAADEMRTIAGVDRYGAVRARRSRGRLARARTRSRDLCASFPIYPEPVEVAG